MCIDGSFVRINGSFACINDSFVRTDGSFVCTQGSFVRRGMRVSRVKACVGM